MNNKNGKIIRLVNQYNTLTKWGKVLEGMRILQTIDNLLLPADNYKQSNNCCSYRELVSGMLFD